MLFIHCSCIKSYEHSCLKLFLNGPEAVFKHQNPCSNHEIHVLFEHEFWSFDITRWVLFCLRYVERPERSILEFYDDVRELLRNWRDCKQHSELAAILVYRRIWRVYMELWGVFVTICRWNRELFKNNDHPWLFHCNNICRVPRKLFEHSA